jgi:hypothetical protein
VIEPPELDTQPVLGVVSVDGFGPSDCTDLGPQPQRTMCRQIDRPCDA